ncbi:hypothetical protein CPB83DRAFT_879539 [Crepidotus variabilis]|uniref:Pyrroloquinoline quinone-dependent pyranose dehydrogenase beta-propeller domain-containing protein n=1 Tax=Crepidotus variabilis TaxID=179855 RepID=A0A9P6JW91_9AGAR|nr:hypothetical protein CPB83DRAFT_879539 [Crepidotus variabilis]
MTLLLSIIFTISLTVLPLNAQSFSCVGTPALRSSVVAASGFLFAPVVGSLTAPRGITVDSRGNVLTVQSGLGISAHIADANGCVISSKITIANTALTHGIDVYNNQLYASTVDIVYAWDYSPDTQTVTKPLVLVTGSGVRNVLGLAEDRSGMIHGVGPMTVRVDNLHMQDNAMDKINRAANGVQISVKDGNPAENILSIGHPKSPSGINGGYPYCFVVGEPSNFVDKSFQPGDWFVQAPNSTSNDTTCDHTKAKKPEAVLTVHTAPLDMKFGVGSDSNLYVGLQTLFHPVGLLRSADGKNLYVTGNIYLVKKIWSLLCDCFLYRIRNEKTAKTSTIEKDTAISIISGVPDLRFLIQPYLQVLPHLGHLLFQNLGDPSSFAS